MSAPDRPTREQVDASLTRADLLSDHRVVWADIDMTALALLAAEVRALRAELEGLDDDATVADVRQALRFALRTRGEALDELGVEQGMRTAAVDEVETLRRRLWSLLGADQLSDDDTVDRLRAALAARTPQPADEADDMEFAGAYAWGGGAPTGAPIPAPLPAVPDGPGEHVGAEAPGVLWMAMRYALGRATYAVQEVGSAIAEHAHCLAPWQRERMAQEIERELGYDADGAAWGADAATWRQAISDLRAPVPAVPDGEDAAAPLALPLDPLAEARSYIGALQEERSQLRAVLRARSAQDGQDVPARLDAAADVCEALGWIGTANTFHDLASQLREWDEEAPAVRAAVAAALARPTGGEQ